MCTVDVAMLYAWPGCLALHCAVLCVCECLVQDVKSGRSKGYGFVTMADKASVSDILSRESHSIEGKRVCPGAPHRHLLHDHCCMQ